MIKLEHTKVFNFEGAFRGLRNPKNSWHLSDSAYGLSDIFYDNEELYDVAATYVPWELESDEDEEKREKIQDWLSENGENFENEHIYSYNYLGQKDLDLAQRMVAAGTDEAKFMRQIFVSFDITAPLYWWKEFDTYKVGTVANSCSTMHKISAKEFTLNDFSHEHLIDEPLIEEKPGTVKQFNLQAKSMLEITISILNVARLMFLKTGDKKYWWQMIQLLPSSYNQKRTITLNYQVLRAMYFARRYHKLDEWHDFCNWIETLPYAKELICYEKKKENEE